MLSLQATRGSGARLGRCSTVRRTLALWLAMACGACCTRERSRDPLPPLPTYEALRPVKLPPDGRTYLFPPSVRLTDAEYRDLVRMQAWIAAVKASNDASP